MDWSRTRPGRNMISAAAGIMAVALLAGPAHALPETIPMKNGVTFRHRAHMVAARSCRSCHEAGPGRITGFGKEWAHKNCKGCHGERNAGPYHCTGCHAKVYD